MKDQVTGSPPWFHVQSLIGKGTFGRVYKARYKGQQVAIKRCPKWKTQQSREVEVLQKCAEASIPNIVGLAIPPIYTETPNGVVIQNLVFPYHPGTLRDLIASTRTFSTPIQLPVVKVVAKTLLQTATAMHKRGIVHRDLKPYAVTQETLWMPEKVDVAICDFGSSKIMSPKTSNVPFAVRGPELLLGTSAYDLSIDQWSLGCLIAELLLGDFLIAGTRLMAKPMTNSNRNRRSPSLLNLPGIDETSQLLAVLKCLGPPSNIERDALIKASHKTTQKSVEEFFDAADSVFGWESSITEYLWNQLHSANNTARCSCRNRIQCKLTPWIDLVAKLLRWCPQDRLSAACALEHDVLK